VVLQIRDPSHLATARPLRPIVEKLGNEGCLLTRDEIVKTLGDFGLKYGVKNPPQDGMAYVDFEGTS
jgi:hypothetical protein